MTRIPGVDPNDSDSLDGPTRAAFAAQTEKWGARLVPHLTYARRLTIYRAVLGMWGGLDASKLLDGSLVALVNRRVASINGCVWCTQFANGAHLGRR